MGKRVIFTEKQIKLIAEAEKAKLNESKDGLEVEDILGKQIGDDEADKKIVYPSKEKEGYDELPSDGEESSEESMDMDSEVEDEVSMKNLKGSQELLEYLDKMEEAKSILSKVAAKEDDEKLKARIYSHYERVQKVVFELIKEFGIVH